MARPLRIEYPGGLYHITSRGNRKNPIYLNDDDRLRFNEVLGTTIRAHNWLCHAYCQMTNHYHLLPETPDGNLSIGMRDLNGNFSSSFNKKYTTVGHMFQGRFKSFIIEKEAYLLEVARYTVLNAVRAGIVDDPADWPWSSYRATAGLEEAPDWLATDFILGFFSNNKKEAQRAYVRFVHEGIGAKSPFEDIREGIVLGSERFASDVWEFTGEKTQVKEIPRSERLVGRPTLEDLFENVGTNKSLRNQAIRAARFECAYTMTEIARHLKLHRTTISVICEKA